MDTGARALLRDDGVTVPLSTGEYDLLIALVERPQRVLNRDQLLDLARGRSAAGLDRSIDTQVSRLRKKLETRSRRPANHQDGVGRRLHVHARGDPPMNRLLPKSLFGQTLLILVAGLIVSLLVGSWIYTLDREQAVRAVGGFAAAQRITNLTKLVQEAPREWRERIVAGLSDQTFRVSLSAQPPTIVPNDDDAAVAQAIKEFLIDQLSLAPGRQPRVSASLPDSRGIWRQGVR